MQKVLWGCEKRRTFADEYQIRQRAQAAPQQFEYIRLRSACTDLALNTRLKFRLLHYLYFKKVRIMSKIAKQLTELVGNTPLLELNKYSQAKGLETPVIAKVEFFNPGGSVKDRIAVF